VCLCVYRCVCVCVYACHVVGVGKNEARSGKTGQGTCQQKQDTDKRRVWGLITLRMTSQLSPTRPGVLVGFMKNKGKFRRVARGSSEAKAPPLAARPALL